MTFSYDTRNYIKERNPKLIYSYSIKVGSYEQLRRDLGQHRIYNHSQFIIHWNYFLTESPVTEATISILGT